MSSILTFLLSFLLLYKYWALFAVVFMAAVIVPIPANTLILAAGAFASQGYFNFWISLLVIVLANMVGDCIDYFLARIYGRRILRKIHVRMPSYLERLEKFVAEYPRSAIFFTRFVGTIEPITSLLCGFSGIRIWTFLVYDFLGNLASDGLILYSGYFLGVHWQDFTGLFSLTDYILVGVTIIAIVGVLYWRKKHNRT